MPSIEVEEITKDLSSLKVNSNASPVLPAVTSQDAENKSEGAVAASNIKVPKLSLYVGDLSEDVNEAILFEVFNAVGQVASIRVCRDVETRRSLGYAYVNFHASADAERALDTLNHHPVKGVPMRCMWSQRDPSARKSGEGNIFIKNLEKTIDNKTLFDTFSGFGEILSCKVVPNGETSYAFVNYETKEAADAAITNVNGKLLNNVKVFVGPFLNKKDRVVEPKEPIFTNVYVKNIPTNHSEEDVKNLFETIGKITSVFIEKNADGSSRGFGFVNFEKSEDAVKAIEELNDKEIGEGEEKKVLFVGRAQKKFERQAELKKLRSEKFKGVNLFLKNLSDAVTEDMLRTEFTKYGNVESCRVMKDEKDQSKGFGFICFSTKEEATKAIVEANNLVMEGKPIYVALYQPKEERRDALAKKYAQRSMMQNSRMMGANRMRMPQQGGPMGGQAPMFAHPMNNMNGNNPMMFNNMQMQNNPQAMAQAMAAQQQQQAAMMQRNGQRLPMNPNGGRGGPQQQQLNMNQMMMRGGNGRAGAHPAMNQRREGVGSNPNMNQQQHQQQQHMAQMRQQQGMELNATMLAEASEEQQREIIGNRLYSAIYPTHQEMAGKITGMLLEGMDVVELLNLLDDSSALFEKVNEAVAAVEAATQMQEKPASEAQ